MVIITIALLVGVFVGMWSWVRSFFQNKLIPAVRKSLGDMWAEYIVDVVMLLDRPIGMVRDSLASVYRRFKTHVLGIRQKLTLVKPGVYDEVTETDIYNPATRSVTCITHGPVRVQAFDLPESLRKALQDQQVKEGVLSWGDALDRHLQQKAHEENIELTLEQANA